MINQQKHVIGVSQNDYHCSCKTLLQRSGKTTVNARNLRNLFKERLESLNNRNHVFRKEVFSFKECNYPVHKKYELNIEIRKTSQVRFHTKILRSLGSKIWNALPYHMKNLKTLILSKRLLKTGIEKIPNI